MKQHRCREILPKKWTIERKNRVTVILSVTMRAPHLVSITLSCRSYCEHPKSLNNGSRTRTPQLAVTLITEPRSVQLSKSEDSTKEANSTPMGGKKNVSCIRTLRYPFTRRPSHRSTIAARRQVLGAGPGTRRGSSARVPFYK